MTIGITWSTIGEASAKYSLEKSLILKWVAEGVVRSEEADNKVVRVNVDDLELEVQEKIGICKE
jgi:hypothetical protein